MSLCVTLVHHHEDIKCKVVDKNVIFNLIYLVFLQIYAEIQLSAPKF